jgi:CPA1 family monovalent cation:H+ antiporter
MVSLAAIFSYLNYRFIKLPATIGIMILSLTSSLLVVLLGTWKPELFSSISETVASINFYDLLINMMLSFLLFAGAIHINSARLRAERIPVIALATISTLVSTILTGAMIYFLFQLFSKPIDIIYCMVFGALISPTDPVAVLSLLKKARIPKTLEMKITAESLFNDGVGVVIFITLLEWANSGSSDISIAKISMRFIMEAGGGLVYGVILGHVGFLLLRSLDNYQVEVLITLAMVMGGYSLASVLHVSGPLSMVAAGIITGNKSREFGMSVTTRDYVEKFWELADEILNAILFLIIGFEILALRAGMVFYLIGLCAFILVLFGRWISVALATTFLRRFVSFERHSILMLTWGGLRGGISVALALSLPAQMYRNEFVSLTYTVVVLSILVQGLTIGRVAKKIYGTR